MSEPIRFSLDGTEVEAQPGETIWQVAQRHGVEIPHLCWLPKPGYRADGNCRACMVEIEGERVLAASCIRRPTPGMKVQAASERAKASRQLVFELLIGDQPERATAHDPESRLWQWADAVASGAPLTIQALKEALRAFEGLSIRQAFELTRRGELPAYERALDSGDSKEGVKAFAEKRKANFKGR